MSKTQQEVEQEFMRKVASGDVTQEFVPAEGLEEESHEDYLEEKDDRRYPHLVEPEDVGEEESSSATVWSKNPSVTDQLKRFPDTVRLGVKKTSVFDMTSEEHVRDFNELQARASHPSQSSLVISEIDKETVPRSWIVTYAALEYAKI